MEQDENESALLDELRVFFVDRQLRKEGLGCFGCPEGSVAALLEEGMAFELPRGHLVQICLFVVFDTPGDLDDPTVRVRYDFTVVQDEFFGNHPLLDSLGKHLRYYMLRGGDTDTRIGDWKTDLSEAQRAWLLAVDGLKDRRGVSMAHPHRRSCLKSGWERVARYETRMLFYGNGGPGRRDEGSESGDDDR